MINKTFEIDIETSKPIELVDLTNEVNRIIKNSKIRKGIAVIFTKHTTTGIRINENEKRLFRDVELFLEKIAPVSSRYLHDDIELRDCPPNERINGHAHIKSLILNSSETIPIENGNLCLGKWQSVFFIEMDGGRKRNIKISLIGE
jgi:secondary thiamine-phosphate synthase enzyme